MHILHLYKDYYPVLGGIENYLKTLSEASVRRGHQVTVLVTSPSRHTEDTTLNGVRVIRAGRWATLASTPLSVDFVRWVRRLRPEVVHLHSPYPPAEMAYALQGHAPYLVSFQADVTRPIQQLIMLAYRPWFRRILRQAHRVLVTTPVMPASSPSLRGLSNLAVVPIGVNLDRFKPPSTPPPPNRPFTVLFVGVLRHYKGLPVLLHALLRHPTLHALIAGEGPMRAELEVLAHDLDLGTRVRFLGRVPDDDLPALYHQADVFVLPSTSRAEAYGMVMTEAMASGLPCITTELGTGTSYVVEHGVTGWVVPPNDPAALAQALDSLVTDSALRAKMGMAGHARALSLFSETQMLDHLETLYQAAVGG